jgi:hypothetical protein
MAFVSAQQSRFAIGLLNASGYATGYTMASQMAALRCSTLADDAEAYIVGQTSNNGSAELNLDTSGAANGQFDHMKTWKAAAPSPVSVAPEGFATGNLVVLSDALETQAQTTSAVADMAKASVAWLGTGSDDVGVSVEDFTAITADTTGDARDGLAASANGGVAHLHVTAFSGLTSDVITIEHSVDGSTSWATLVTFATVTGLTSERVVVAAGTSVRRYLRVVDDVTGTGSITRQISFARR